MLLINFSGQIQLTYQFKSWGWEQIDDILFKFSLLLKSLHIRCSYFISGNCDFLKVFVIKVELLSARRSNRFVFMCRRRRGSPAGRDFCQSSAPNVLRSVNPHPACSHLVSFGTKSFRGTKFLRFRLSHDGVRSVYLNHNHTRNQTSPGLNQAACQGGGGLTPLASAPGPFRKPFKYQSNPWLALGSQLLHHLSTASDSREEVLSSEFRSARLVMHSCSMGNLAVEAVG